MKSSRNQIPARSRLKTRTPPRNRRSPRQVIGDVGVGDAGLPAQLVSILYDDAPKTSTQKDASGDQVTDLSPLTSGVAQVIGNSLAKFGTDAQKILMPFVKDDTSDKAVADAKRCLASSKTRSATTPKSTCTSTSRLDRRQHRFVCHGGRSHPDRDRQVEKRGQAKALAHSLDQAAPDAGDHGRRQSRFRDFVRRIEKRTRRRHGDDHEPRCRRLARRPRFGPQSRCELEESRSFAGAVARFADDAPEDSRRHAKGEYFGHA